MAENRYLPLTCDITLITVTHYRATLWFTWHADCQSLVGHALTTSRLDYANSVLFGSPISYNCSQCPSVCSEFTCSRHTSGWSFCFLHLLQQLHSVHRLPIERRISFKLATLAYKVLASGSPAYLSSLLTPYHPAHTLRSSDQLLLQRFPTKSYFGSRAFCSAAPSVWNLLPYPVRASRTLPSFKRALKTYYF